MSDSVKNIVDGLKDDPREPPETPPPTAENPSTARRTKVENIGSSEQRGARRNPKTAQLAAIIRKDLRVSLWYYVKREGRTMSAVFEQQLEAWVKEQDGLIEP